MRRSELAYAVANEFGEAYGQVVMTDLVLAELGDVTAEQAVARGVPTRDVWLALCRAADVPPERWHGVGLPEPKRP